MRDKPANADREVARIAAQQHGVVSMSQLRCAGLNRNAVTRRAQGGRLHSVHRGIYAVGHIALTYRGRCMAAILACGKGAAVSHRSAAALWGLLPHKPGPIHVSVPSGSGREKRKGIRVHRRQALSTALITNRYGIRVTTPAQTIADIEREVPAAELRRAIRQAEVLGLRIGFGKPSDRTRSELEHLFLDLCRRHRLPMPEVNVRIGRHLVDFLWREQRLVVETDGYRYHRGPHCQRSWQPGAAHERGPAPTPNVLRFSPA